MPAFFRVPILSRIFNHSSKALLLGPVSIAIDQQLGAMIAEGKIDAVIFLWDPMQPHPHDVDVKALLRIAVLYNVPMVCNRATADFVMSSPLMEERYMPAQPDCGSYTERSVDLG